MTEQVTQALSLLTILGNIMLVVYVTLYIFARHHFKKLTEKFAPQTLWYAWIVAFIAMAGSLYYSDIARFTPCLLCWYQRICMYPLVVLLFIAARKKDVAFKVYGITLAGIGALIAAIHYYEQVTYNPLIPCSALGYSVSCTERFIFNYGYITIPMMSLTAFLLILMFLSMIKKRNKSPVTPRID